MASMQELVPLIRQGDQVAVAKLASGQPLAIYGNIGHETRVVTSAIAALRQVGGETELAAAMKAAQLACIAHLVKCYGIADLDRDCGVQYSLLEQALATGRIDVLQFALELNPVFRISVSGRCLALEVLGQTSNVLPLVDVLLSHPKLEMRGFDGSVPKLDDLLLQFAIHHDNTGLVRALVERGADVGRPVRVHESFRWNFCTNSGEQAAFPVHFAVSGKMVTLLESFGAKLDASDPSVNGGENALYPAIRFGNIAYTKYLVARGISVHHRDVQGRTPLHCAAQSGSFKEAGVLLAAGSDVNAADAEGETPLMKCIDAGQNKALFAALLAAGADPFARDKKGHHRLFMLTKNTSIEPVVERIVKNAAGGIVMDQGAKFDFACNLTTLKFPALARKVMECEAFDFNLRGVKTTTPVHEVIHFAKDWTGFLGFVEAALQNGFDLESRNARGNTPLMEAITAKNSLAVRVLLAKGADAHAVTKNGTPAYKLARDANVKTELYSVLTAEAVDRAFDPALENDVDKDTMDALQPQKSKTNFGML